MKKKVPSAPDLERSSGGIGTRVGGIRIVRQDASRKIGGIKRRFTRREVDLVFGVDERLIKGGKGPVVGSQQHLDVLPEILIEQAFTIQDGGAVCGGVTLGSHHEHNLNTLGVERHGMVLESG